MINPIVLEEAYREFTRNLPKWAPDGVILVDLKLLDELGLLSNAQMEQSPSDNLSHYFHIVETPDKVTLFNEHFAIWIIPQSTEELPKTMTMIALLPSNKPHLEVVFTTSGVYNTPKYILKILQHFLSEVQDTEALISSIRKKP
jgi:hypothetical protein